MKGGNHLRNNNENFLKKHLNFKEDKQFALLTTLIITGLAYIIFFGQVLFSDVVTFAKQGDQLLICYPLFVKVGELLKHGAFTGVDINSFNGATEFFLRANMPTRYLPLICFSALGAVTNSYFAYILFYLVHTFIALYYAQRVVVKFFNMNKWIALIFAASFSNILLYESWCISFFIACALIFPLLYSVLSSLDNNCRLKWLLYSLPYTLAFTCGYTTMSVFLVGIMLVFGFLYGLFYRRSISTNQLILNLMIPFGLTLFTVITYIYSIFDYTKQIVGISGFSLSGAMALSLDIRDIIFFISKAFVPMSPIEQMPILTIGLTWFFVLFLMFKTDVFEKMNVGEKWIFWIGILLNVLVILISFGNKTSFAVWSYSSIPILGAMHLPIRYLMVTLPIGFISLCVALKHIAPGIGNRKYLDLSQRLFVFAIIISILPRFFTIPGVDITSLTLEIVTFSIILFTVYKFGWQSKINLLVWTIILVVSSTTGFYQKHDYMTSKVQIDERSIVYNKLYQKKIDDFIERQPKKELYKLISFNSKEVVPMFIPGNYGWFNLSKFNLSSYSGYELHLCLPKEYQKILPWFNNINWSYLVNTRASFAIMDQPEIDKNIEVLSQIVDWDASGEYVNNEQRILKFKSFIPKHYTGSDYTLDSINSLDNGYFYAPNLTAKDLTNFETDGATYYKAVFDSIEYSEIAFLLYPNRFYRYEVDGNRVQPIIDSNQAFIKIGPGKHTISIQYDNHKEKFSVFIMSIYYICIIICALYLIVIRKRRRKI